MLQRPHPNRRQPQQREFLLLAQWLGLGIELCLSHRLDVVIARLGNSKKTTVCGDASFSFRTSTSLSTFLLKSFIDEK